MSRPAPMQFSPDFSNNVFPQCQSLNLSWLGGQPPFSLNAQTWYMNIDQATGSERNMTNSYTLRNDWDTQWTVWTAAEFADTTVFFNVSDTYNDWAVQSFLITNSTPIGTTPWCLQAGTTYTPTNGLADVTRSPTSYSDMTYMPWTSSSSQGIRTVTQTMWPNEFYDPEGKLRHATIGFGVVTALLSASLLGVLLVNHRLRKRLHRLQTSQSTVGNWMNHHGRRGGIDSIKFEKVPALPKKAALHSSSSRGYTDDHTRFSSGSSTKVSLFSKYTDRSSGLSSFFQKRSASRGVSTTSSYHHQSHMQDSRDRDTTAGTSERHNENRNPFALEGLSEVLRIDTRSPDAASRRTSHAETINSDFTETSAALSSVAPSEQATSVAGYSTVSDEHYHRRKAFTISPTTPSTEVAKSPFLDPNAATMASRR